MATLPADWARQYATVLQLQYSKEGEISDVTPTNAVSTVDSVLAKASANFAEVSKSLDSFLSTLGKAQNLPTLKPSLSGAAHPPFSDALIILPGMWHKLHDTANPDFEVYIRRQGNRWYLRIITDRSEPTDFPVKKREVYPMGKHNLTIGGFNVSILYATLFSASGAVDFDFDDSAEARAWPFSMAFYKNSGDSWKFSLAIGGLCVRDAIITGPVSNFNIDYPDGHGADVPCPTVSGETPDMAGILGIPQKSVIEAVQQDIDSLLG